MKKIIVIMIFFYIATISFAQTADDIGKIALSVVMPENVDDLDVSQLSKLETKITKITSAAGLAAVGYNNNFVIYPKFAIYDVNVVEGGMQNISVVTAEVSFFIKQVDNNIVFSTVSKDLKGSGKNKETAITNAISSIPVDDAKFKKFIESGKMKILQYYESKCQDIIIRSESLVKMQDYGQALGLLMTVPEEVSCYNKVQEKAIEAFKAYQNHRCKEQIQLARAELEANNYHSSLEILSQIDPAATCFEESRTLMKTAGSKVDAEEKKQWDFAMKVYNDDVALEKLRINAIKDIAVAYYKSQPTSLQYIYIIK
ncbi:MAG: hypothetical protein IPP15_04075 [Saprospiraceae bacterium]|uniref:Tetratricopeptide repeat protein n=1 Tax=Candidatus Opimibacter skivensis TaxID=2982028 RepID=A0A9D7STB3_9BACT|nr:hypothetical protein [Candidatus Opimibacter skivensis]